MALETDPDLVVSAMAGDRRAFARLFEQYGAMVHGVLLARVHPREVEDLMQDVFVAALERIESIRDPKAFGGWLATVARNRVVDFRRTRKPTEELFDEHPASERDRVEAERILVAIQSLPEAYRETLVMKLVEGMSGPEIAAQVGITAESVRVNLHRGMKLLREKLGVGVEEEKAG